MSWNKVIERASQEVSYRLGNRSHNHTDKDTVILNIIAIVNSDGTPVIWSVESKCLNPRSQAMELLKALLT